MQEIIDHIDSLLDEECSRLEIIESLMSEFGSGYPDYDYIKWREIVKTRIEETKGDKDDEDGYTSIPQINVISIKEKYDKALNKANNLLKWEERKSRSIRYWSLDSINRWVNHYQGCQQLFSSLEDDFAGNMISVDLYQQSKTYLSQLNSIYSKIPQETLFKCKSLVPKGSSDYRLSSRYLHLPINVQRRFAVAMPRQRKDLRNFISLSTSEKDYHTYSDLYLEQILRIPYLTKADENKYFEQYLKGDENAKDAIVESYLPTIYNIAQKYVAQSPDIDIQDLIGEGVYALCKAIPYYDPSSPARLITFAIHGIRGAMYEYVLHNRIVHIPSNQIVSLKKIQTAYDRFEQENERRPSAEELACVLNEYVDRVAETLKMSGESVSLEGYEDLICTENEDSPFYKLYQESLAKKIDRALEQLTPREADILRSYFGIGVPEKTLEEIGMELDLTRERVRQIKEKAVRKLKTSSRSGILRLFLGEENFYELSPGSRLCADSPVEQRQQTIKTVQNCKTEQTIQVKQSPAEIRIQRKQEKIELEVKVIEERIAQIIKPRLNELALPEEESDGSRGGSHG